MRGRQQLYPTFEDASNRLPATSRFGSDMLIFGAAHAHFWSTPVGMWVVCPFLVAGAGHVPRGEWPGLPRQRPGRANWAKRRSSGILVSAFDSKATGEFA